MPSPGTTAPDYSGITLADLLEQKVIPLPNARTPDDRAHESLCARMSFAGPMKRLGLAPRPFSK